MLSITASFVDSVMCCPKVMQNRAPTLSTKLVSKFSMTPVSKFGMKLVSKFFMKLVSFDVHVRKCEATVEHVIAIRISRLY